jgi:serpin B
MASLAITVAAVDSPVKESRPPAGAVSDTVAPPGSIKETVKEVTKKLGAATEREVAILAALKQPVSMSVNDQTLADALEMLRRQLHIQIVIDPKQVPEPVGKLTFDLTNISGRAALDILLSSTDFDWDICHEVLWITSRDEIKSHVTTKVYDVADLVLPPGEDDATPDFESIVGLITSTIQPQAWDAAGGIGSISPLMAGGRVVLVVRQNRQCHEEIAKLLADLRAAPAAPKAQAEPTANKPGAGARPAGLMPAAPLHSSFTPPKGAEISPERQAVADGNNLFACEIFAKLSDGAHNEVFSPLSISTAMAMVYAGARKETASEIAAVMHFSLDQEKLHPAMASLNNDLLKVREGSKSKILIANRLWGQTGYKFLDAFQTLNRDQYGAELGQLDFAGQPDAARKTINDWIAAHTAQKIKELIPTGGLDNLTRLVVTNAIFLDGKWSRPFEKSETRMGSFHGQGQTARLPMMSQRGQFDYANVGGVQILEKPFDNDLSMTILLPAKGAAAFDALRKGLTAEKLNDWHAKLKSRLVVFELPRFKIESATALTSPLESLGIHKAFDSSPHLADFSGMDGSDKLMLRDVFHEAWVDVNEEGAKAAAATAGGGAFGGIEIAPPPIYFRADHPFVFLIRERNSGAILFLGQVANLPAGAIADG